MFAHIICLDVITKKQEKTYLNILCLAIGYAGVIWIEVTASLGLDTK